MMIVSTSDFCLSELTSRKKVQTAQKKNFQSLSEKLVNDFMLIFTKTLNLQSSRKV